MRRWLKRQHFRVSDIPDFLSCNSLSLENISAKSQSLNHAIIHPNIHYHAVSHPTQISTNEGKILSLNNLSICNLGKSYPPHNNISHLHPPTILTHSTPKPLLMDFPTLTSFIGDIHPSKAIFKFQMNQSLHTMGDGTFYCSCRGSGTRNLNAAK